ncbi:MAG: hypothetical protein CMM23_12800 [Rhodospirillaceae bacterium]|nr:hypothetical protein [Rhodospirillaceae bacterium]
MPVAEEGNRLAVEEIMTKQAYSCTADSRVGSVLEQMSARSIHHVPVVQNRVLIGIVSTHDLLFAQRKILVEDNKRRQQIADTILMSQLD